MSSASTENEKRIRSTARAQAEKFFEFLDATFQPSAQIVEAKKHVAFLIDAKPVRMGGKTKEASFTEHEILLTLASQAMRLDDLTGHDVIETLQALGYGHIVEEARELTKDDKS